MYTSAEISNKFKDLQQTLMEVWGTDTRLATHHPRLAVEIQQGSFTGAVPSEFFDENFPVVCHGNSWNDQDNTSESWWTDGTECCERRSVVCRRW